MSNYMQEAFAPVDALNRAIVMADTWGYPKPGIKYPIKLLLAHTEMGETTMLRYELQDDLYNPFFWEDVEDVLYDQYKLKEGEIYQWVGYYIKFKNGNCRFTGKITHIEIKVWNDC